MQPVQLRFTYTEAEYVAASRLLLLSEKETLARLAVAYGLLFFGMGVLLMLAGITLPPWFWAAVVFLGGLAVWHQLFNEMPRKYFRGDQKLRDEYLLTFSDEGVWLRTERIDSKMSWSLYKGVRESKDLYVIVYGRDTRMMTVVPKRAFRDADQELEFRRLLSRHVERKLPPRPASGAGAEVGEYVPSSSGPPDWR